MTPRLDFAPGWDLPLLGILLVWFLWHCRRWSTSVCLENGVEVSHRWPAARRRIVLLFMVVTGACWLFDLPAWLVVTLLGLAGVIGSVVSDFDHALVLVPWLIREWAFGFPHLILQPSVGSTDNSHVDRQSQATELFGARGTVVSPLRPCGQVQLDDQRVQAVSESGQFIDQGTLVIVCGLKGEEICVRPLA